MRNYLTIIFSIICLNLFSQSNKGKVFIDAMSNFNWTYSKMSGNDVNQFKLKTGIGKYITDKMVLGGLLDFSYYGTKYSQMRLTGVGGFNRLYLNDSRLKLFLFGELEAFLIKNTYHYSGLFLNGNNTRESFTSGVFISAGPGLEYSINEFVAFEGVIAPVYALYFKNGEDQLSMVLYFGFNLRF